MFVKLFKSSYLLQIHLFFIIAILLWLDVFISPLPMIKTNNVTPFYTFFYNIFHGSSFISEIIEFILLCAESIMINHIVIKNKITNKINFLPAFVFFLISCYNPNLLRLNPVIISNLFLIVVISQIFNINKSKNPYQNILTAGIFTSIASLFYFPAILFILIIILSLIAYRTSDWNEFVISFIGLLTPYIFLFTFYFLTDNINVALDNYYKYFNTIKFTEINFNIHEIISMNFLFLLLIMAILKLLRNINSNVIILRKKYEIILFSIPVIGFCLFFNDKLFKFSHLFLLLPYSIIISHFLMNIKKKIWVQIIFILFFAIIISGKIYAKFTF